MVCSEFRELLDRYESIDELDRECMEAHCDFCDECRTEMEFFRLIINISASIPCPAPPKTLIAEVNDKLDEMAVPPVGGKVKSWSIKRYATLAACLAVGIAVGVNSSYIKDRLNDNTDDGVIRETVSSVNSVDETDMPETVTADVKVGDNKPAYVPEKSEAVKDSNDKEATPQTVAPVVLQTPVTTPAAENKADEHKVKPTESVAQEVGTTTQTEPVTTPSVNDYAVVGKGNSVAYYSVGVRDGASKAAIADYILISDGDMGAVFSIISELGVSSSDGYYMTTRTNFYRMLDRFDAEGIEYDYQLIYNTDENIAFKLRYSVVR